MIRPTRLCAIAAVSLAASSAVAAPPRQSAYDFANVHISNDENNEQQKAVETDYVPNVVQSENGANTVHEEALKAQAVAARSFLYYKMNDFGYIGDGQSDQVYTGSGTPPNARHLAAARDTEREVLRWGNGSNDVTIASFYVSGARPSSETGSAPFGVAEIPPDSDPLNVERHVTYNRGLAGNSIDQTSQGFQTTPVSNFPKNRGSMSQNGSDFLADNGWNYRDILRYYYGADIHFEVARTPASGTKPALKLIENFNVDQGYFGNAFTSGNNRNIAAATRSHVTAGAFDGAGAQQIIIDKNNAAADFTFFNTAGLGPNSIHQIDGTTPGQGTVATAATNLSMESIGSVGFWLKATSAALAPDLGVALLLDDDADGRERGTTFDVAADGLWHKYEWFLDDPDAWINSFNGDGTMDGDYFSIDSIRFTGLDDAIFTLDNVFYDASATVPVPEPTSLALLALATATLIRRRRR